MFKILVVIKKTSGYSPSISVALTSQVIEFELREWAESACKALQSRDGHEITKLYN